MACKEEPLALMAPATDPYLVGVAVDVRTAFEETQPGRVCMVVCVCVYVCLRLKVCYICMHLYMFCSGLSL